MHSRQFRGIIWSPAVNDKFRSYTLNVLVIDKNRQITIDGTINGNLIFFVIILSVAPSIRARFNQIRWHSNKS